MVYIDNNAVENAIRPIAVGKKNWLFAGSERAGQRATVIQSLMGTAKPNGLDPAAWFQETLDRLPTWPIPKKLFLSSDEGGLECGTGSRKCHTDFW